MKLMEAWLLIGPQLKVGELGRARRPLAGLWGYSVVLCASSSITRSPSGESAMARELRHGTPTLNSSSRLSRLTLMEGISKLKRSANGWRGMAARGGGHVMKTSRTNMIMVRWKGNMMVRVMKKDKGEKKGKQIKFLVQHLRKSQRGLV